MENGICSHGGKSRPRRTRSQNWQFLLDSCSQYLLVVQQASAAACTVTALRMMLTTDTVDNILFVHSNLEWQSHFYFQSCTENSASICLWRTSENWKPIMPINSTLDSVHIDKLESFLPAINERRCCHCWRRLDSTVHYRHYRGTTGPSPTCRQSVRL